MTKRNYSQEKSEREEERGKGKKGEGEEYRDNVGRGRGHLKTAKRTDTHTSVPLCEWVLVRVCVCEKRDRQNKIQDRRELKK